MLNDLNEDGHHATFYRAKLTEIKAKVENGNSALENHKIELAIIVEQLGKNLAKKSTENLLRPIEEEETKSEEEEAEGRVPQKPVSLDDNNDFDEMYEEISIVGMLRNAFFGRQDSTIINCLTGVTYDNPELVNGLVKECESKRIEHLYKQNTVVINFLSDEYKQILQEHHRMNLAGDLPLFDFGSIQIGSPPYEQPSLFIEENNGEALSADSQVVQQNYINDYGQITTSLFGVLLLLYSQSHFG